MNASKLTTNDRRPTIEDHSSSLVTRHSSHLGWLIFALGAVWDVIYHAPTILLGAQWPPALDAIGEFGHVITFLGIVTIIFAVILNYQRQHS